MKRLTARIRFAPSRGLATLGLLTLSGSLSGAAGCGGGGGGSSDEGDALPCDSLFVGDVVITELSPDGEGSDAGREWFEIFNASSGSVSLEGLSLISSAVDGGSEKEHTLGALSLAAGEYWVLGNVLPETAPEHVDYGYGEDLGDLRNTAGRLAVKCGDRLIDEVLYEGSEEATSWGYDGARAPDAIGNDDLNAWCAATQEFAPGQFGSPGAANEACAGGGGGGGDGTCVDGDSDRPVVPPVLGDLVISEVMPNPAAVPDGDGEWIEITALADFDLNGLELGRSFPDSDTTLNRAACHSLQAGDRVLVAASLDSELNGGLSDLEYELGFGLTNSGGSVFASYGGELLDEISWSSSPTGASWTLAPGLHDPELNDDAEAWCEATSVYGAGDLGTPGAENDACPISVPPGMCLDGEDLRAIVPPTEGELVITEFMANPAGVADADGEWFELSVQGSFDLNELEFGTALGDPKTTLTPGECMPVQSGEFLVFARELDSALNGGVDAIATFDFGLLNSSGSLVISHGGTLIDQTTWGSAEAGVAESLDPDFQNATDNDDPVNWCLAVDEYGSLGDLGTPGIINPSCEGGGGGTGGGGGEGTCLDGGSSREIVVPQPGDLIITEAMPNPDAVSDAAGEWFEIRALAPFDLNGLELGQTFPDVSTTIDDANCLPVQTGDYRLFARGADSAMNGGLGTVDGTFSFGLTNSNASLFVGHSGVLLDATDWASSSAGASRSLDPAITDPDANDGDTNWCPGVAAYGDGDLGTPRAANPNCP